MKRYVSEVRQVQTQSLRIDISVPLPMRRIGRGGLGSGSWPLLFWHAIIVAIVPLSARGAGGVGALFRHNQQKKKRCYTRVRILIEPQRDP